MQPIAGHGHHPKFTKTPTQQSAPVNKNNPTSTGIIKNIPFNTNLAQFQRSFNQNGQLIKDLYRISNKLKQPTDMVKITFNVQEAPTLLLTRTESYPVYPCEIPYLRCNNCQEHGHSINTCPGNPVKCPLCAGNHNYSQCTHKTESRLRKCSNCYGQHGAASKSCPFFLEQKYAIDRKNNITYIEWSKRRKDPTTHRTDKKLAPLMMIKPPSLFNLETDFPKINKTKNAEQPATGPDMTKTITLLQLKHILTDILHTNTSNMSKKQKESVVSNIIEKHVDERDNTPPLIQTHNLPPVPFKPNVPRYAPQNTGTASSNQVRRPDPINTNANTTVAQQKTRRPNNSLPKATYHSNNIYTLLSQETSGRH